MKFDLTVLFFVHVSGMSWGNAIDFATKALIVGGAAIGAVAVGACVGTHKLLTSPNPSIRNPSRAVAKSAVVLILVGGIVTIVKKRKRKPKTII